MRIDEEATDRQRAGRRVRHERRRRRHGAARPCASALVLVFAATLLAVLDAGPATAANPGDGFYLFSSPAVTGLGYSSYTIRPVNTAFSANPQLQSAVQDAATNVMAVMVNPQNGAHDVSISLGAPVGSANPVDQQITVEVVAGIPCAGVPYGSWAGCSGPGVVGSLETSGHIQIALDHLNMAPDKLVSSVRHELGHALGLAHFDSTYNGSPQVMLWTIEVPFPKTTYQAGDINGLNYLADHGFRNAALINATVVMDSPPDALVGTDGKLSIRGWAKDPQQTNRPTLTVRLGSPQGPVLSSAPYPWALYTSPGQPTNLSYWLEIDFPADGSQVCVVATNVGPGADGADCKIFTLPLKRNPNASAIIMPGGTTARAFWNSSNQVWTGVETAGSSAWPTGASLALGINGAPTSVTAHDGKQWVFWRGDNDSLWGGYPTGSNTWSWFQPALSPGVTGSPTVVSNVGVGGASGNVIDVYYRGDDGNLWHVWTTTNGTNWLNGGSPFHNAKVANNVVGTPAVTATEPGVMNVFFRRADSTLGQIAVRYDANYNFTNSVTEYTLASDIHGDPTAASLGTVAHVFYTGNNFSVVHTWWNNGWGAVDIRALGAGSAPAVARAGSSGLYVYWTSPKGVVMGQYLPASGPVATVTTGSGGNNSTGPIVTRGNANGETMVLWSGANSLWAKNFLNGAVAAPTAGYLVGTNCC